MMDTNFYDKHTNRTSEWYTPLDLYKELDNEFHFVTDPAAEPTNRLGCKVSITKSQNGLDNSKWKGPVFINPPYSDPDCPVYAWTKAAYGYNKCTGNAVVMLLRSTTEVKWFQDFVWDNSKRDFREGVKVRFPDKRLRFVKVEEQPEGQQQRKRGRSETPTFASVIVIFKAWQSLPTVHLSPPPSSPILQQHQRETEKTTIDSY